MSLVGNYCLCSDGKWYAEAVWHGEPVDGVYPWFVVLDDDDPPELVVQAGAAAPDLPWFQKTTKGSSGSSRLFGNTPSGKSVFRKARVYFGELILRPPPPQKCERAHSKRPDCQGVFYAIQEKP